MEKIDDYVKRSEVLALEKEVYVKEVDYRIRCIDASEVESLNGYVLTAETEAEIRKAVRVIIREAKRLTDAMIHYLSELAERKGANSDLIDRQAAIGAINALHEKSNAWLDSAVDAVMALPSAQPEIITCIDCIHYTPLGKDKAWGRCPVHSSPTENQRMCQSCDFCAWAERRTNGMDS